MESIWVSWDNIYSSPQWSLYRFPVDVCGWVYNLISFEYSKDISCSRIVIMEKLRPHEIINLWIVMLGWMLVTYIYIYIYMYICCTTLLQCSLWNWKRSQLSSPFHFWHARRQLVDWKSVCSFQLPLCSEAKFWPGYLVAPLNSLPTCHSAWLQWNSFVAVAAGGTYEPMVLNDDELVDNVSGALRCSICLNVFTEPAAWRKITVRYRRRDLAYIELHKTNDKMFWIYI